MVKYLKKEREASVICLITTKNRESFYQALKSVTTQTCKADCIIIVSDSDESLVQKEQEATESVGGIFLRKRHSHARNYAGSLNLGIDYIIEQFVIRQKIDPNKIYLATLDDDDIWHEDYLKQCSDVLVSNPDFVVSGLNYINGANIEQLDIPQNLSIHSFLQGNPHIQGSNTFVRLSTLLSAGCFDESMPSTTDRDIFVRLMQQKPRCEVVNEFLVDVNATGSERITKNRAIKLEGLHHFYRKYHHLMTNEDRQAFHQRNRKYFGITEEEIKDSKSSENEKKTIVKTNGIRYEGQLIIGIIVTYEEGALRLLNQLQSGLLYNDRIVLLNNTCKKWDWYPSLPQTLQHQIILVPHKSKEKMSIAESRQKLQEYIFNEVWENDDSVCWLLDDDMELKQLLPNGNEIPLDIRAEIPLYQNKYDAVIGGYTNDAPLPLLPTLRLQLLDYTYSKGNPSISDNSCVDNLPDNYYSLSDSGYNHLECPVFIDDIDLEKIFQGYAQTRKLANRLTEISDARNRGGNTLIFNKELLLLPTCSLEIKDIKARRGDFFWALSAKKLRYRICQGTFCTYHNREKKPFDFKAEMGKMLKDIIGSSMTKAIERIPLTHEDLDGDKKIVDAYTQELHKRLAHFIQSYYRIIGLLNLVNGEKYLPQFTEDSLWYFIHKLLDYSESSSINAAFRMILRKLDMAKNRIKLPEYRSLICEYLDISNDNLQDLGQGNEGCVFQNGNSVYKLFYDKNVKMDFLRSISQTFKDSLYLYPLEFSTYNGYHILSHKYDKESDWEQSPAMNFVNMLLFGKEHGFCFCNLKPDNFIVTEDGLKYIDYGKDIVPFDEEIFERSIERSFQVFRYYFLKDVDFKELISRSYEGTANAINSGLEVYKRMFYPVYKEDIHDTKVIETIKNLSPPKILDYGAGKCKIANQLCKDGYQVDVFDINIAQLYERAAKGVGIIETTSQIEESNYGVVNCNQVLCWTDDTVVGTILQKISAALKPDGHLVLSICNPFFTDVQHTMLRGGGRNDSYYEASTFQEYTVTMKPIDDLEQHRPVEWYVRMLRKYGFDIIDSYETDGINTDNAFAVGEHLVFVCRKAGEYIPMPDLSLLIKTCAMDHANIYESIRHIVTQLEYGCSFKERIVCVDGDRTTDGEKTTRARVYSEDDFSKLMKELQRAQNNGLIDRIVLPDDLDSGVYQKYFAQMTANAHSQNGQPLLMTLNGFEQIKTPFVYQTDCDILFFNKQCGSLANKFADFKTSNVLTMSLSICHEQSTSMEYGCRVEVRNCFLNLPLLNQLLPLENQIEDGCFTQTWHRSLDLKIKATHSLSLRCHDKDLFFIHVENKYKTDLDMLATIRYEIERGFVHDLQRENVNLTGTREDWIPKTKADVVVVSRGKNTPIDKVKRMLDSLLMQDFKDFALVYTDAHSTNASEEYAAFRLRYDKRLQNSAFIPNKTEHLEIDMLMRAVSTIANKHTIIITVDNDDYLLRSDAIGMILEKFKNGADYVCGNNIRYDKPLRKYRVGGFDKLWERNGDNIWLHPICFTKELFKKVNPNDMKRDGEWINICTDFAYAVPMIQLAKNPQWIERPIYFFEPSIANQKKEGNYRIEKVNEMRNYILQKAKQRYETDNSSYRR